MSEDVNTAEPTDTAGPKRRFFVLEDIVGRPFSRSYWRKQIRTGALSARQGDRRLIIEESDYNAFMEALPSAADAESSTRTESVRRKVVVTNVICDLNRKAAHGER